jgi:hypothetical protein
MPQSDSHLAPSCTSSAKPALAKTIQDAMASGQLGAADGARYTCNSALLLAPSNIKQNAPRQSAPARRVTPSYATRCRNLTEWDYSWTNAGITAGGIKVALEWCYNGASVSR